MTDEISSTLLGQLLLGSGTITPEDLAEALRRQEQTGARLGDILLEMGALTPRELERALRAQTRLRGRPDQGRIFVLVVDDDLEVGAVVADILEGAGYRVGVAQNDVEALAAVTAANESTPAVVVLDLGLPTRGGIELLSMVRSTGDLHNLPVIILTGRPDLKEEVEARGLEVTAFLSKPVSARKLVETVEAAAAQRVALSASPGG